jgi:hypothetical protein
LEFFARERECLVFVEVAVLADLSQEGAEVVGADRAVDDLAFAEVGLGCVRAQDRGDVCVEIDAHVLAGSHAVKAIARAGPVRRWGGPSGIIARVRALSMADQEAFERSILRRRWQNALHRMGIATVGDLRGTPEKRLLEIPMIGPKAVADIAAALRDPSACSTDSIEVLGLPAGACDLRAR